MTDVIDVLLGIGIGIFMMGIALLIITEKYVMLSQETANDICNNLGFDNSIASSDNDGKLICEIPSYDSTTNIIIKGQGDDLE